jgi:hypothetical protein
VIADTQVLGRIPLITGELTPNLLYSEPLKNIYIGFDEVVEPRIGKFGTLEEAQQQCNLKKDCFGVTKDSDDQAKPFSIRTGGLVQSRRLNPIEISWVKIKTLLKENRASDGSLPWKIQIFNEGDWSILPYTRRELFPQ